MKTLILAALCTLSFACSAAAAPTPAERTEAFLAAVAGSDPDKAFDELFVESGIAERKPEAVATLKSQARAAIELYGKPIGFEKIREEDFTPSLKRLVYLQKFAKYPVVWELYFYKAASTWTLNQIVFNDQVGGLVGAKR